MMSTASLNIAAALTPTRRLRIALVTETYPPEVNGVAMTIARLVKGLVAGGHQVQLIRPCQDRKKDQVRQEGDLDIHPQPGFRIPFYREVRLGLPVGWRLYHLWRQQRPDLVHLVTPGPLGAAALGSARRLGITVSSGFHTHFQTYSRYYGLGRLAIPLMAYLRWFHNRTACTLVPTPELATQLGAMGFGRTVVLSRGVDTTLFTPHRRSQTLRYDWGVAPDDLVALYVGRLAAEKNLELLLATFQAMRQCGPKIRLVIVGGGPLATTLRAQHPEIIFCGVRQGIDLATHYASADIFLFPSLTETFGNVTLEAMASGLAVVAFDYAAAHDYIQHARSGLLAPCDEPATFTAQAQRLAEDPELIPALGREARNVTMACDWERVYQQLESFFLELCATQGNP
ncbi:MAG: glycosyltransferase family 1 protein [Candidatus Competibacteraceae bacterium]